MSSAVRCSSPCRRRRRGHLRTHAAGSGSRRHNRATPRGCGASTTPRRSPAGRHRGRPPARPPCRSRPDRRRAPADRSHVAHHRNPTFLDRAEQGRSRHWHSFCGLRAAAGLRPQLTVTTGEPGADASVPPCCSASRMASSMSVSTIWDSGTVLITSPLDEDLALPLPDATPRSASRASPGPLTNTAHHGHPQRHVEPLQAGRHRVGQGVDVDLGAATGRAGHDLEPAGPQVQRLQDLGADLDLFDRRADSDTGWCRRCRGSTAHRTPPPT